MKYKYAQSQLNKEESKFTLASSAAKHLENSQFAI